MEHVTAEISIGYPGVAIKPTVKNVTGTYGKVQENYGFQRRNFGFYNGYR